MLKVGLTGMSGSGKGYISELLVKSGVPCLDTDLVSRQVCGAGMPCTEELRDRYGVGIIRADGSLDRAALREIVFSDPKALSDLNAITHKHILARCREWLSGWEKQGILAAVIDAPQLYESGFDSECDLVIAVTAPRAKCIKRILERDGVDEATAEKRLDAQHGEDFFRKRADIVIENAGGPCEEKAARAAALLLRYAKAPRTVGQAKHVIG